jgi:DNA topoisomerase-1
VPARKKQPLDAATPVTSGRKKKAAAAPAEGAPITKKRAAPRRAAPAAGNGEGKVDLVIVESPAKAKTINKYLGSGYVVLASYGHVRDLPPKGKQKGEEVVGVSIADGWKPRYVVVDRSAGKGGGPNRRSTEAILAELKREADRAGTVYLATDPDREGESIAWHIAEALELDPARTRRITFQEITRSAVQNALANPSDINAQIVQAQEARRVLDRVVGYPLSNLLGKKVTRGLSAGRVQSVAVKLVVDREREIEAFKTEEYWKITALLSPQGTVSFRLDPARAKVYAKKRGDNLKKDAAESAEGDAPAEKETALEVPAGAFSAELARWEGREYKASTEAEADAVYAVLDRAAYAVAKVEQKDKKEYADPPFTTSTLQQQASIRLRFSTRHTMSVAQELYQGVQLGAEGAVALITYMRTDSTRVSNDALKMVRDHIQAAYGDPYLPERPNTYKSGKSAQEAHEAIRPTDLTYTPERVRGSLSPDQFRLYELIYRRFVASQMTPALFALTNVEVNAGPGLFKAQGRILKFDGYRRVLPPAGKQEDRTLPPLAEGQALDKLGLIASQHFTQPPPRYNEASLVKVLEKEGIGRPSTYATIISTIQQRGYVKQEQRRFHATEVGKVVTDLLVKHFAEVMDLKFTSHIEEELDQIENGKAAYGTVLDEFWAPFSKDLREAEEGMPQQKGTETGEACPQCGRPLVKQYSKKTGREFVGCSGWRDKEKPCNYIKPGEGDVGRTTPVETEHKCPTCGKVMLLKTGRFGQYLACSGAPECKTTMNLGADGKPVISAMATEHKCEKCGKPMVIRQGRRGPFLACTGYPKCKNAKDVDAEGKVIPEFDPGIACEKCGAAMKVRKGPRGPFLGCSAYPKCRGTMPMPDELKEKYKAVMPAPAPKKELPKVEVSETCPECGGPMKLLPSRFGGGYFLGCANYPKCKGKRQLSAELLEQIQAPSAV